MQHKNLFAWLALGAVTFHGAAMVLLHFLAPEINPVINMVSDYLGSQYQLLARSTFLALGCALASLGLMLRGHLCVSILPRIAAALLLEANFNFNIMEISMQKLFIAPFFFLLKLQKRVYDIE